MKTKIEEAVFYMMSKIYLFSEEIARYYNVEEDYRYEIGKKIPKIGEVHFNQEEVKYRFHGDGCTFWTNDYEVFYKFDYSKDKDSVVLTEGGVHCFLKTYVTNYINSELYSNLEKWMIHLEERGVFLKRAAGEQVYHVNLVWFKRGQVDQTP